MNTTYIALIDDGSERVLELHNKGCHPECFIVTTDNKFVGEIRVLRGALDPATVRDLLFKSAVASIEAVIIEFRAKGEKSRIELLAELEELKREKVGS